MDFDLGSIMDAVFSTNQRQAKIAAQVTGNSEQAKEFTNQAATSTVSAGENDAIVAQQKGLGELKAQQNARKYATAVGSNMDDSNEIMTALGMQYREAAVGAIEARKKLEEKSSVNFLDSPVDFIMNTISRPYDEQEVADKEATADRITSTMAKINQDTQQTVVTQNAIAETKNQASIEAAANSIRDRAAAQAASIQLQGLSQNTASLEALARLDNNQLGNLFNANSAIMAQKHLALSQAQFEEQKKNNAIMLEERKDRLEAKQLSRAEQEDLVNTINNGRRISGFTEDVSPAQLANLMKMPQMKKNLENWYTSGSAKASTGLAVIDSSVGKAAITVAETKAPLSSGMQDVRKLMVNTLAETYQKSQTVDGKPFDPKNRDQLAAATDSAIKFKLAQQAANIKVGDATNIYQAPSYSNILRITPGVAKTDLYQKVLGPMINTGLEEVNPQQVVSLATAAIKRGDIKYETTVKDIKALFSGAAAAKNATADFLRVGLEPQTSYNTTLDLPSTQRSSEFDFSDTQSVKVNMLNEVSIGTVLSKKLAKSDTQSLDLFPNAKPVTRDSFAFGPKINFPRDKGAQ